jgi:uncharacterized damage-inducible protein DinB
MLRFTGDESYRARDKLDNVIAVQGLAHVLYEHFDELLARRRVLDDRIASWVEQLDEGALRTEFTYKTSAGAAVSSLLWQTLGHVFNHQTHHRGQITTLLTQQGVDVGSTDLVVMLREETRHVR